MTVLQPNRCALSHATVPGRIALVPRLLLAAAALTGLWPAASASQGAAWIQAHYDKNEVMVPMRDGVRLFTSIYSPKDTARTYPILLLRTPYSVAPYGPTEVRAKLGPSEEFGREGFIFVFQDVRGKFRSEGEFVVLRPYKPEKKAASDTDESSDTYDTIEWLLRNIPGHNGRVGQWGVSYAAWQTVMGMIGGHPALKAASPQASPSDMFVGDDFHHNGAFRLMYAFSWLAGNARPRTTASGTAPSGLDLGTPDGYRFFLEAGSAARIDEFVFRGEVPAWREFIDHPDYDSYWEGMNLLRSLEKVEIPVLTVAGWFDAEDFFGPMSIYGALEQLSPSNLSTLVVGPWKHGGWNTTTGEELGNLRFGAPTSTYFQREVLLPFFNRHLKVDSAPPLPEVVAFETGSNKWRQFSRWPPEGVVASELYLRSGGRLSFSPPGPGSGLEHDEYVSDPARPVPFSAGTHATQGHLWMVEDQRFASTRPDVLVYESEPLDRDLTIAGPIPVSIVLSSSGTDSDFVVKLIDVFPNDAADNDPNPCGVRMGGFQMLLSSEVFRAKYRKSFARPEPLVPDQPFRLEFDLPDRLHTFLRGHRVMVQIQSSWFPLIDRNPQQFVNIYRASPEDYRKATQRVYHSNDRPSYQKLGVLPATRVLEDRVAGGGCSPSGSWAASLP